MSHAVLDELARANRPDQFGLLERAMDLFTTSPAVTLHRFLDDTDLVVAMGGGIGTLHELTAALWYSGNIRPVPVWLAGETALRLSTFLKAERWLFESPTRPLGFLREIQDLAIFQRELSTLLHDHDGYESHRPEFSWGHR